MSNLQVSVSKVQKLSGCSRNRTEHLSIQHTSADCENTKHKTHEGEGEQNRIDEEN